jgi:hypothetical protein
MDTGILYRRPLNNNRFPLSTLDLELKKRPSGLYGNKLRGENRLKIFSSLSSKKASFVTKARSRKTNYLHVASFWEADPH